MTKTAKAAWFGIYLVLAVIMASGSYLAIYKANRMETEREVAFIRDNFKASSGTTIISKEMLNALP
jgi:hypothetical protein